MKTSLKTLILLVLAVQSLCAQERWKNYTNKDYVTAIAIESDKVWIGSQGGILLRDTSGKILAEYTKADGLASNGITSIAIDAQGNKWFGTVGSGVSKFDGRTWTNYNTSNSGLVNNTIFSVATDSQGNIWFGTREGLCKFDYTTWTTYTISNSGLASNNVKFIAIDAQGNKWCATDRGVSKFDDSNWITYKTTNSGLKTNFINNIAIDAQGNKWFGTGTGVFKFDDNIWTTFTTTNSGLPSNNIYSLAIDSQGNKWFGTELELSKFDGINWTKFNEVKSDLSNDFVNAIAIDSRGNRWFGTKAGIYKMKGSIWVAYNSTNSGIANNGVPSMAVDSLRNKWFATNGGGLSKFDGNVWTTYNKTNSGLKDNNSRTISIDAQGNKWIGTYTGLFKLDSGTWTVYNTANSGLASNNVVSVAIDAQGNKWVGTYDGGISKFDGSTWVTYNSSNSGLANNSVSYIAIDAQGNKWFGTLYSGVSKFDGSTWTTYNTSNSGLADNGVQSITIDSQGNKWFGTRGGICKFDGVTWTTYNTTNSGLAENSIWAIAIDSQGSNWFGTSNNGGVSKFDGSTWVTYNTSNSGLASNYVVFIDIDAQGNKWFGTIGGGVSVLLEDNPYVYTYSKTISGKVFLDKNKNSIKDTNEHYLSNQKVSLNQGKQIAYTNTQGAYTLEADTGKTYTLSYVPAGNYKLSKDTSYTFRLGSIPINLPDFAVYAPDTTIYKSNIVTLSGRCSQETTIWLTYNNFGTTLDNTKIEIQLDKDIIVKSSFPAYNSLKNNKLYFTLANFQAGTDRQIKLNVQNPDFTRSGDTLLYTSKLTANGKVFADTLKRRVTCAYDPNIKEVSPAPIGAKNYTLKNKPLNYTVHFQNTGNDTAYHVLIKDTISKFLDYNSLQITGSSHSLSTTLDSTSGLTQFMFNNIMLADSNTNEKASHGFVSYTIKPKANLPEETMIKNTAYIYFDYNPAVVTNTTLNNLVTTIPNGKVTAIEDHLFAPKSIIIPHPLSSRSAIQFKNNSSASATLQVLDLTGQSVLSKTTTESEFQLNRNEFNSAGLYIYQIKVGNEVITGKLLVE